MARMFDGLAGTGMTDERSETAMAETGGWSIEHVREARRMGPHMLEILIGWQRAEQTLQATGISCRDKLRAADDLRGLFESAEAIVNRIANIEAVANYGR